MAKTSWIFEPGRGMFAVWQLGLPIHHKRGEDDLRSNSITQLAMPENLVSQDGMHIVLDQIVAVPFELGGLTPPENEKLFMQNLIFQVASQLLLLGHIEAKSCRAL